MQAHKSLIPHILVHLSPELWIPKILVLSPRRMDTGTHFGSFTSERQTMTIPHMRTHFGPINSRT